MDELGKIAYEAYKDWSEGKSLVDGTELPDWQDLPQSIRDAWIHSALAVQTEVLANYQVTTTKQVTSNG